MSLGTHLQTHEVKFYKFILIGSTRCSLSKCYLVLVYNFDHLKACLQKKVRRADVFMSINCFHRCSLWQTQRVRCPPKQPLLSLLEPCALGNLAEKNPNSHFPQREGRSESKTLSDLTLTISESHSHLLLKGQMKCPGVEMKRTLGF